MLNGSPIQKNGFRLAILMHWLSLCSIIIVLPKSLWIEQSEILLLALIAGLVASALTLLSSRSWRYQCLQQARALKYLNKQVTQSERELRRIKTTQRNNQANTIRWLASFGIANAQSKMSVNGAQRPH